MKNRTASITMMKRTTGFILLPDDDGGVEGDGNCGEVEEESRGGERGVRASLCLS